MSLGGRGGAGRLGFFKGLVLVLGCGKLLFGECCFDVGALLWRCCVPALYDWTAC